MFLDGEPSSAAKTMRRGGAAWRWAWFALAIGLCTIGAWRGSLLLRSVEVPRVLVQSAAAPSVANERRVFPALHGAPESSPLQPSAPADNASLAATNIGRPATNQPDPIRLLYDAIVERLTEWDGGTPPKEQFDEELAASLAPRAQAALASISNSTLRAALRAALVKRGWDEASGAFGRGSLREHARANLLTDLRALLPLAADEPVEEWEPAGFVREPSFYGTQLGGLPNFFLCPAVSAVPAVAGPLGVARAASDAPSAGACDSAASSLAERQAVYGGNCLVFLHLEKSGGTSLKRTLDALVTSEASAGDARDAVGAAPSGAGLAPGAQPVGSGARRAVASAAGTARARAHVSSSVIGFTGGGANGSRCIRRPRAAPGGAAEPGGVPGGGGGGGAPSFLAIFREPLARLVSSYTFCQAWPYDQLCGSAHVVPARMSLLQWARHWGNYLFRQLLVPSLPAFTRLLADAGAPPVRRPWYSFQKAALCKRTRTCADLGKWTTLKRALRGLDAGTSARSEAALQGLLAELPAMFAAVGLLERWAESMELFAMATGFDEFRSNGRELNGTIQKATHGSERWAGRSARLRAEAAASSEIRALLAADLRIYARVQQLFEAQLAARDALLGLGASRHTMPHLRSAHPDRLVVSWAPQ